MTLHCCGCQAKVEARLTNGAEIYPHRRDLGALPFWICDTCKNYVGCHHQTADRTRPLGNIPTAELRKARNHIHARLDPLWKNGRVKRTAAYAWLTEKLGWKYHTAKIRDIEEAREVYRLVIELERDLYEGKNPLNGSVAPFL